MKLNGSAVMMTKQHLHLIITDDNGDGFILDVKADGSCVFSPVAEGLAITIDELFTKLLEK